MSAELGTSGQAIWDAYGAAQLDAPSRSLILELARCADVLDRINDVAIGRQEGWASLVFDDMGEIHLSIDKVLDEQRRTQVVFKTIFGELRQSGIKPGVVAGKDETIKEPEDMLAALKKRKADRERQSG